MIVVKFMMVSGLGNWCIKFHQVIHIIAPIFQDALNDEGSTGSYFWRIRQPGDKGVPSYILATMLYPFVKDMVMPLLPNNVMEAFEVRVKILGALCLQINTISLCPVISFEGLLPSLTTYVLFFCARSSITDLGLAFLFFFSWDLFLIFRKCDMFLSMLTSLSSNKFKHV